MNAPQPLVIFWPFVQVAVTVHLVIADAPAVTLISPWKPPVHSPISEYVAAQPPGIGDDDADGDGGVDRLGDTEGLGGVDRLGDDEGLGEADADDDGVTPPKFTSLQK